MAYLKNDYKLMYENRDFSVSPTEITLRATKTNPAATDANLTYKKEDGTLVNPEDFKFITEIDGNFYGSISGKPSEATVKFSVYCGDDCIYGDDVQPGPVPVFQISAVGDEEKMIAGNFDICWNFEGEDPITTIARKSAPKGTRIKVYVEPNFAAEWDTLPTTCQVNGVNTQLTAYGSGFYYVEVILNEDTAIVFNTGTTRVPTP